MEMISSPCAATICCARSSSSSVRSTMFFPNTMRNSAPTMPISRMDATDLSMSGENSSVMAASGKYCVMEHVFYRVTAAPPSDRATAGDQLDQQQRQRDHQQDVDEAAERVGCNQAKQPKY